MLRTAISAFTRVFNALCGALLIRGPFAFHRDHHALTKNRCDDAALNAVRGITIRHF
jgi:hypothetical protein